MSEPAAPTYGTSERTWITPGNTRQLLLFARGNLPPLKTGRSLPAVCLFITDGCFSFSKHFAVILISFIIAQDEIAFGKAGAVFILERFASSAAWTWNKMLFNHNTPRKLKLEENIVFPWYLEEYI